MKITYEVNKDLEKIYENGVWHLLRYNYKIILTELTLENRVLLGLPTTDSNEVEFKGKALTDAVLFGSKRIPAINDEFKIKTLITEKMERKVARLEGKLIVHDEKISVTEDEKFKSY
jgi:hypothetical protein